MDSMTRTRPSHYEVLGVKPSAGDGEISRAFAAAISPFRPHGPSEIAAASVAYEALRDPVRRRAYDISIGLRPEKEPVPIPPQGWQFVGSMHVGLRRAAGIEPLPWAGEEAAPEAKQPEVRPAEPAAPLARPTRIDMVIPDDVDEEPTEWKRPVLLLGGLFAGVALIGATAGVWAARDIEPDKSEAAVPVRHAVVAGPMPSVVEETGTPLVVEPTPERGKRAAPAKVRKAAPSPVIVASEEKALAGQVEALRAEEAPEISSEQVAAQASEASASIPLSDSAIAQTLGRIGYSCGTVESTAAVGNGAFKVTCSSGQSYQAAPVRGRYHFRKWKG